MKNLTILLLLTLGANAAPLPLEGLGEAPAAVPYNELPAGPLRRYVIQGNQKN